MKNWKMIYLAGLWTTALIHGSRSLIYCGTWLAQPTLPQARVIPIVIYFLGRCPRALEQLRVKWPSFGHVSGLKILGYTPSTPNILNVFSSFLLAKQKYKCFSHTKIMISTHYPGFWDGNTYLSVFQEQKLWFLSGWAPSIYSKQKAERRWQTDMGRLQTSEIHTMCKLTKTTKFCKNKNGK